MNYPANLKYTKDHEWILVEGELSFSQRSFRYILNGNKSNILQANFEAIKSLMNDLYIGEFSSEKALEKLNHQNCFAVFPGDGWWYVAGNSWKKPNGNQQYFATLEDQLKNIFS